MVVGGLDDKGDGKGHTCISGILGKESGLYFSYSLSDLDFFFQIKKIKVEDYTSH